MKTDTWMPLYIGDYLRDTLGLNRAEHGSYMLLIMAYWVNGGPIDDDDNILREIAKCPPEEWMRTRGLMQKFFKVENGKWIHKRIDQEKADAIALQKSNEERARNAALKRWAKDASSNAASNAQAMPEDMLGDAPSPSPSPIINTHTSDDCFAEIPSLDEVLKVADLRGIPKSSAESFFKHHNDNQLWVNQYGRLIKWQDKLKSWAEKDRQVKALPEVSKERRGPFLKDVQAYCAEKWGDDDRHRNWAVSFHRYWSDQRRQWKRKGVPIEWQSELTKQVAVWRAHA